MSREFRKFYVRGEDIETGEKAEITLLAADAGDAVTKFESAIHYDIVLVQRVDDLDEVKLNERALKRITKGMTTYQRDQVTTMFNSTKN